MHLQGPPRAILHLCTLGLQQNTYSCKLSFIFKNSFDAFLFYVSQYQKDSFINSPRVHGLGHTHSLASLQWSGLSDQRTLLPTTTPEMEPLQMQRSGFYARRSLCWKGEKWPIQGQPRPSTASQGSHHVHGTLWLCPLFHVLITQTFFKTDCADW